MLWQFFFIFIAIWLFIVRWQNRGKRKMTKYFKNNCSLPIVGDCHNFIGNDEDRMNGLIKYGYEAIKSDGVSSLWLGNRLFICIACPVEAEAVLKHCLEKDEIVRFAKLLLGNATIFAPVPIWRLRRKILAPTFGQKNLNQFVSIFAEQSNVMVDKLEKAVNKGTFSIWKYMTSYSMDSVCQTTMGINLNVQGQDYHPFHTTFENVTVLGAARTMMPWLHSDFIYKLTPYYKAGEEMINYLKSFVMKIIKEKRLVYKNGTNEKNADDEQNDDTGKPVTKNFLELLLDCSGRHGELTDLELQEETLAFMVAGTDTSAVGISFTLVMLSKHADIQDKVYQEIMEVVGEVRPITPEDLTRLKYLDAVLRETLRLYPPAPIIVRSTDKDFVLPSGRKILKNTPVVIHIWATHRYPKYWGPDAETFRPERFIDLQLEHHAAYMPFSYGPRNCIGYQYAMMSMKTVLASLVRRYKILPSEQVLQDGDKPLKVKYDFMMKHVDKYQIQLVKRK